MDEISVKRTFDHELLTRIYTSDDIFEIGADDGVSKIGFKIPQIYVYKNICLLVKVNKKDAGVIVFSLENNILSKAHISLLKEFRNKDTPKIINLALSWLFKNTGSQQVMAQVSAHRDDIKKLIGKCGFKCRGLLKDSFLKNGKYHDLLIFQLEK